MNPKLRLLIAAAAAVVAAGCTRDSAGPGDRNVSLTIQSGNQQHGTANGLLAEPLKVIVVDASSKAPVNGAVVRWRLVQGTGAQFTPGSSTTGADGVAATTLRLGGLGDYAIEATADNVSGLVPHFTARAVLAPLIASIIPTTVNAGASMAINGSNFSPIPDENTVLFGGFRARVVTASSNQLGLIVPPCLPSRTLPVQAMLGAVGSNLVSVDVIGGSGLPLLLAPGESVLLSDVQQLGCQRFTAQSGLSFLIVPQNFSQVVGSLTHFEVSGLAAGGTANIAQLSASNPHDDYGSIWELNLRARERSFQRGAGTGPLPSGLRITPPDIGDRRTFKVYNKDQRFVDVTAEVKAISDHAIIYQDLDAPANGFVTSEFQQLGASFDHPIYDISVQTFGSPSDQDGNGKVIILLTPVVNALTPRGSSGFVTGFFFGCDLLTAQQCSGTNQSELFYLLVPDPTGIHGDARSKTFVLNAVTPVLAHEFQHMINFAARKSLDAVWLSEGLAHMAEEIVGADYAAAGDAVNAGRFRAQNYSRASLYLRDSTSVSLLADDLPGTLELRGAAWLMVMYLAGHHTNTVLRTLTQSTVSSVQNVTAATSKSWSSLLSDWAVALWADDAPDLAGVQLKKEFTFPNINLRNALGTASYPLIPRNATFGDFAFSGTLRASSQRYIRLNAGALAPPVSVAFTGQRGGPFATGAQPQLTILRIR